MSANKTISLNTFSNTNTTLSDDEVKYLYKLLFYLADLERNKNTNGFYVKDKELSKFLKKENIELDYKKTPEVHYDKNKIIFVPRSSTCFFLLKHIRNAFAHGRLTKIKNQLEIVDTYNGKITAYGIFTPNVLFKLIDKIITLKKTNK